MEVAIVTGASKGLGRALAAGLAVRGWSVVIDARSRVDLEEAAEKIRSAAPPEVTVSAIAGDVASSSHRRELVEAALGLGGVDLLVNNASTLGVSPMPELASYPLESLREVLEVDLISPVALFGASIEGLRRSGNPRLLNITSDASVEHYERWGGYGLAKAALDHATGTIGAENPWLRAWTVDPGDLRTEMHQRAFPGEDISDRPMPESAIPAFISLISGNLPSGRYRASEIALEAGVSGVLR
jgi:NAD(P)-dependent dehydrogenase (short-subunit alcohol dehydrogenase family)